MSEMSWQDAVAITIGAKACTPTERLRAIRMLEETGIAEKIGGKLADIVQSIMEDDHGHRGVGPQSH